MIPPGRDPLPGRGVGAAGSAGVAGGVLGGADGAASPRRGTAWPDCPSIELAGDIPGARLTLDSLLRIQPDLTLRKYIASGGSSPLRARVANALSKLGVPR